MYNFQEGTLLLNAIITFIFTFCLFTLAGEQSCGSVLNPACITWHDILAVTVQCFTGETPVSHGKLGHCESRRWFDRRALRLL